MAKSSQHEAAIPNPALAAFSVLLGTWTTLGSHPLIPEPVHGQTTFGWIEGGAFLIMHSQIDEPGIPSGTAIFGSDDALGTFSMLYFDERGVSRKYEVSLNDMIWTWWRHAPGFSQRFTGTISEDGRTIVGKGEICKDDSTWEPDLDLTYTRAD